MCIKKSNRDPKRMLPREGHASELTENKDKEENEPIPRFPQGRTSLKEGERKRCKVMDHS